MFIPEDESIVLAAYGINYSYLTVMSSEFIIIFPTHKWIKVKRENKELNPNSIPLCRK